MPKTEQVFGPITAEQDIQNQLDIAIQEAKNRIFDNVFGGAEEGVAITSLFAECDRKWKRFAEQMKPIREAFAPKSQA